VLQSAISSVLAGKKKGDVMMNISGAILANVCRIK
jgi:hypothetical protein